MRTATKTSTVDAGARHRDRVRGPLELVGLRPVMELSRGHPDVAIGLVDGPVDMTHPALAGSRVTDMSYRHVAACSDAAQRACGHGTFVAGVIAAQRSSLAPAICPGCTVVVRPIYTANSAAEMPTATPDELASAIVECVEAGVRVINLSAAISHASVSHHKPLGEALDLAAHRGVLVAAAAGNRAAVGSTPITRHPWVIPVVAYDLLGRPLATTTLGHSIGRLGLGGPGVDVTSLAPGGAQVTSGGTSAATPFVSGAAALLWSLHPHASPRDIWWSLKSAPGRRRTGIVPPLLDAYQSHRLLSAANQRTSR